MRRGSEGFALLASLWFLAMVSTIAVVSLVPGRTERLFAANAAASVQARSAAKAGVVHALARLNELLAGHPAGELSERPEGFFSEPELARLTEGLDRLRLGPAASYSVTVRDAHVRLPLNTASEEELIRLFRAAGVKHRTALVAAASVLDWRDPDDLHRAHGAEWPDFYGRQAPPRVPRNGPFESLEELRFVRGIDERLFAQISRFLTVGREAQVNVNAAPDIVLRALHGMTAEAAGVVMARRRTGRPLSGVDELQLILSAPARVALQDRIGAFRRRTTFRNSAVEIEAVGQADGSPVRRRLIATAVVTGRGVQVIRSRES